MSASASRRARWQILVLFVAYALYHGLAEGAERAIIADLAERGARGRAFGLYHGLIGVAALPAGFATGWIWDRMARSGRWGSTPLRGAGRDLSVRARFAGPLRRAT